MRLLTYKEEMLLIRQSDSAQQHREPKIELHTFAEPFKFTGAGGTEVGFKRDQLPGSLATENNLVKSASQFGELNCDSILVTGTHRWLEYIDLLVEGMKKGKNGARLLFNDMAAMVAMIKLTDGGTKNSIYLATESGRIFFDAESAGWKWASIPTTVKFENPSVIPMCVEIENVRGIDLYGGTTDGRDTYNELLLHGMKHAQCDLIRCGELLQEALGFEFLREGEYVTRIPYFGEIKEEPAE